MPNKDKNERIASVCKVATYRSAHIDQDDLQKEAADFDWGNIKDTVSDFWANNKNKLMRGGIGGLGGYALSKLLGMGGLGSAAMAAGGAGLGYGSGAIRRWLEPYLEPGKYQERL